jgi:hypothetical protein
MVSFTPLAPHVSFDRRLGGPQKVGLVAVKTDSLRLYFEFQGGFLAFKNLTAGNKSTRCMF